MQRLTRSFFERDTITVARELLGKILVHEDDPSTRRRLSGYIVETEAYCGLTDPASHAACGKTARNAALFGSPGSAYVYLIYGLHTCLNLVAHPADVPAGGVLIRALEPLEGREEMEKRRGTSVIRNLTNGPGKVGQALGITLADNGLDVTSATSRLYVLDPEQAISWLATPRIGISKNVDALWRFIVPGNPWISRK